MDSFLLGTIQRLYEEATTFTKVAEVRRVERDIEVLRLPIPSSYKAAFFKLIDQLSFTFLEEEEGFYSYFLFQMGRDLMLDLASATAILYKGGRYSLVFNPLIFLTLTPDQMKSSIKHEILHILSLHLLRAKD